MQKVKYTLIALYILILIIPGWTIIQNVGGIGQIGGIFSNTKQATYFLLRFFALYAITLLFVQLLAGAFMMPLRKILGKNALPFHIIQGTLAYLFLLFHPILYGVYNIQTLGFMSGLGSLLPQLTMSQLYLNLGRTALILFTLSIVAGALRTHPFLTRHWRKFHIINYLAFAFIILHSRNLGSDVSSAPFVFLYPLFIGGLIIAICYKRVYIIFKQKLQQRGHDVDLRIKLTRSKKIPQ